MDLVVSIRYGLYLGSREESFNFRVVVGIVYRRERRLEGVKKGRWGEKERR